MTFDRPRRRPALRALPRLGAALALALVCAPVPASAQTLPKGDPPITLAERDRSVSETRPVRISIQRQIGISVDIGRLPALYSGGLLDSLIINSTDNRREIMEATQTERALGAVQPLRLALADFDVDTLARSATKTALARLPWFNAGEITIDDGPPERARADALASTSAPQLATITYRYDLSPDFAQIRVLADFRIEQRAAGGGPSATIFRQRLAVIQYLAAPSYEPPENAVRWHASNGARARQALTAAFARFEQLIPLALALTPAAIAALRAKRHEQAFAAGFYGPLIARNLSGHGDTSLWVNGLLLAQPVE